MVLMKWYTEKSSFRLLYIIFVKTQLFIDELLYID